MQGDVSNGAADVPAWSVEARTAAGVAVGGAIGATARWLIGVPLRGTTPELDSFPWSTFLVNVIGCLLIGVASVRLAESHRFRPFLVTGVLGGFTTMSAFAVELNDLADASRNGVAAAYLAVTLVTGACAVLAGEALAGRRRALPVGGP